MPIFWTQEKLKLYFGDVLDLLYDFANRYEPKDEFNTDSLLVVQIYQAFIFEKKFKEQCLIDYNDQDIRKVGLLYGLDNIYKKNNYIKVLKKSNINNEFVKKILGEQSLEKLLAERSRLVAEFILQYSVYEKESIKNMADNPLIDQIFIKYLFDYGVLKEDLNNFSYMMSTIELYKQAIKSDLNYLLKKTKNINKK